MYGIGSALISLFLIFATLLEWGLLIQATKPTPILRPNQNGLISPEQVWIFALTAGSILTLNGITAYRLHKKLLREMKQSYDNLPAGRSPAGTPDRRGTKTQRTRLLTPTHENNPRTRRSGKNQKDRRNPNRGSPHRGDATPNHPRPRQRPLLPPRSGGPFPRLRVQEPQQARRWPK